MCTDIRLDTGERRFSVTINGKQYTINGQITLDDLELYSWKKETTESEQILAEIVLSHVKDDDKPLMEEILHSKAIVEFVNTVCSSETGIGEKYSDHAEIEDSSERFLVSANEYFWDLMRQFPERMKESLNSLRTNIVGMTADVVKTLSSDQDYSFITRSTQDVIRSTAETAANSISGQIFAESTSQVFASIITEHQKIFREALDNLYDTLPLVAIQYYPRERIDEICEASRAWGDYGWTFPDWRKISRFFTKPTDRAEADKTAMSYCDADQIKSIFDATLEFQEVRRTDYQEAVDNYKDQRYKSCAMILFSLIDAFFIRRVPIGGTGNHRSHVGCRAIKEAKGQIDDKDLAEQWRVGLFRFENLFACLMKVFEAGDCRTQKDIINRNFLLHGMMTVEVTESECIRLFLLYFNLLDFYEDYEAEPDQDNDTAED